MYFFPLPTLQQLCSAFISDSFHASLQNCSLLLSNTPFFQPFPLLLSNTVHSYFLFLFTPPFYYCSLFLSNSAHSFFLLLSILLSNINPFFLQVIFLFTSFNCNSVHSFSLTFLIPPHLYSTVYDQILQYNVQYCAVYAQCCLASID